MIGILAGMGPMSTAPFIESLMKEWQNHFQVKYDIDFPHVLIYSLPTPFYIDKPIDHNLMEKTIKEGLKNLQEWGAKFIAMPCNTAHRYFDVLQESLDIKLLNIINATIDTIPKNLYKISILATESTVESGLYQIGLEKNNKEFVFCSSWQSLVNDLINAVKVNTDLEEMEHITKKIIQELQQYEVEAIIIGCTDISLIIEKYIPSNIAVVDSSKSLVKAIINELIGS